MIKKFEKVTGRYIEKIIGQEKLAYAMSDTSDMYDLVEWSPHGGYPGSVIMFFDFETGKVYQPFEKKRNVLYGIPIYAQGYYYFLQGDYDAKKVTLYRYLPETEPEIVTEMHLEEVNLYNLRIVPSPVHVISQDDTFVCYYPDNISFALKPEETVELIEDGKVYLEAWAEEGWDEVRQCASENYRYYHKVIVKDYLGNTLSEETGSLFQSQDGTWWIS